MIKKVLLCLMICFLYQSCGPKLSPEEQELQRLERDVDLQPSPERADVYIKAVTGFIGSHRSETELITPYLHKGYEIAKENQILARATGFLIPLLRKSTDEQERLVYLTDLGEVMYNIKKRHASNVIYKEMARLYPDNEEVQTKKERIDSIAQNSANYMQYLFEQMLVNPDDIGINRAATLKFVDCSEAYALSAPKAADAPIYLYRAGEAARSMRDLAKAMSIYEWILDDYPDYERAPTVLFITGFMLEQEFNQPEEAKKVYEKFIQKYPDDEMVTSAEFLLENLGKSNEEILRSIEKKRSESTDEEK